MEQDSLTKNVFFLNLIRDRQGQVSFIFQIEEAKFWETISNFQIRILRSSILIQILFVKKNILFCLLFVTVTSLSNIYIKTLMKTL